MRGRRKDRCPRASDVDLADPLSAGPASGDQPPHGRAHPSLIVHVVTVSSDGAFVIHDPQRGKLSTIAWQMISDELKNFVKKYHKKNDPMVSAEEIEIDQPVPFDPLFEYLSNEAQQIANLVLSNAEKYSLLSPSSAKKEIIRQMIEEKKWSKNKVRIGIRDLKLAFK